MKALVEQYTSNLTEQLDGLDWRLLETLGNWLIKSVESQNHVFICGNGGSAGNAMHLANDFLYGVDPAADQAIAVEALSSNSSILTCLGNDIGYDKIFSHQLKVKAKANDILIVLSGSGNSPNILNALDEACKRSMKSVAILGYDGGKAKKMCDLAIHFPVDDMQIAEDLQLVVGHILMRFLNKRFGRQ